MKRLIYILFALFALAVAGCEDDNYKEKTEPETTTEPGEKPEFTADFLYQTAWKGQLTVYEEGVAKAYTLFLFFDYSDSGQFRVADDSRKLFDYEVEGNRLTIINALNYKEDKLFGDWWLTSLDKNAFAMRTRVGDDRNYSTIDMKRTDY